MANEETQVFRMGNACVFGNDFLHWIQAYLRENPVLAIADMGFFLICYVQKTF